MGEKPHSGRREEEIRAPARHDDLAQGLDPAEALDWMERAARDREAHEAMLALARRLRDEHLLDAREVAFCGILQSKLGGCPEDCAFCCQSSHHKALGGTPLPLASLDELMARARAVAKMGARAFSIVTAGRELEDDELERICAAIEWVASELGLECCASLGRLARGPLERLRDAGLTRYHHNLEAAPSHFPKLISTYSIDESLETVEAARDAGLALCSSGVFGTGESDAQRVELISLLRDLEVEGTPLNFLEPHVGTPLGDRPPLDPDEALRIIALHRLMMPTADVIVAGGRQLVFGRDSNPILDAGANAVMVGDYTTDFGGELERDHAMVRERGFTLRRPHPNR